MNKLSQRLSILQDEYPGDSAWEKFVSSFPDIDSKLNCQFPLGDDVIKVLYWKKGNNLDRVKHWIETPIPALDNNTVCDILKYKQGQIILRSAIMRMP